MMRARETFGDVPVVSESRSARSPERDTILAGALTDRGGRKSRRIRPKEETCGTGYCRHIMLIMVVLIGGTTMIGSRAVSTDLCTLVPPVPPGGTACSHQILWSTTGTPGPPEKNSPEECVVEHWANNLWRSRSRRWPFSIDEIPQRLTEPREGPSVWWLHTAL
jgi:hypothetical protein